MVGFISSISVSSFVLCTSFFSIVPMILLFLFFFFYTLFIVHRHADFVSIRVLTNVRACKSHLFVKRTGLHVYMHSGHDRYTRSRSDLSRTSITTPSSLTFKLCSRCDRSRFSLRTPITYIVRVSCTYS